MSHDELPPAEPSASLEETAPDTAREASSADAPPAAGSRRRRARPAQSEATSAAESVSAESARPSRSRRKTLPSSEPSPAPPPPAAEEPTPAPPETPARTPRRRQKAAARPAEAADRAASPEITPQAESAPSAASTPELPPASPENAEPAAPARSPRRRASRNRRAAPPDTAAPPEDIPATGATAETPPVQAETTEQAPPAATEPTRRRRGGRRRSSASAETAETPEAAPSSAAAPVQQPETETPAPEVEGSPSRARRSRRERSSRRGKGRSATPEETALAEGVLAGLPGLEPIIEEKIDRTVGAHLVWHHGLPEIHIQGVAYPPIFFFGNVEEAGNLARVTSEVRHAAHAGVHLHSTLVELPCPLADTSEALEEIDRRLQALLAADPEGFVMPRIVFVPARGWKREYPTEIATYADGSTGDPSITSERFWQEAELSLATLIAHLRTHEWGPRVFGYHLERGEWFQPADQGYDRSMANRDAFRDWLRDKYKNSLVALRAAWYDGDVQFHTAEIPPLIPKPNQQMAFYETRRQRRYIDFHEFTSDSTARRLIALARAIKRATNNQALVSVCYGYTLEFGHPFSGHLALGMLQSAQAINLICGPPSYRDRRPGGAASVPAPVDSLPLHGKLWVSEDDTKTYLAPAKQDLDDYNPRLGDRFVTEQAHARAMGWALAHVTGINWMDLWGEGWLDEAGVWERLGAFTTRYYALLRHQERAQAPDVVVLIDERSLLHVQRGEVFFRRLTNSLRDTLQRAGISYGTYLQSDLLSKDFPTSASLYLFLTPYRLTPEQRAAIKEKLQRDGKTLAWLYAPGTCEEIPSTGSGTIEETAHSTVGFTLRPQEWNSEVGSRVIEPYHPLTERLLSREIGPRERLNPSFYVDDRDATALAEYQDSGLTSLAVKNFGTWKSVFLGDPVLPLELLRGLCRYAGVHVWCPQGEDVVAIGNGWVTIHASRDGQRTLYLPDATGLYDVTEGRLIADEAFEYRFVLRAGMTRIFCVGTTAHFVRLGFPNVALPGEGRPRIVLAKPTEVQRSAASGRIHADLETLEAVLTMDVSALEEVEPEPLIEEAAESVLPTGEALLPDADSADGEAATNGRRRRRRGGRGRWRKRTGSLSEGAEGTATPDSSAETSEES